MKKVLFILCCLFFLFVCNLRAGSAANYAREKYSGSGCAFDDSLTSAAIIGKTGEHTNESMSNGNKLAAAYSPNENKIYIGSEYSSLLDNIEKIPAELSKNEQYLEEQKKSLESKKNNVEKQKEAIQIEEQNLAQIKQNLAELNQVPLTSRDDQWQRYTVVIEGKNVDMTYNDVVRYYREQQQESERRLAKFKVNLEELESIYEIQQAENEKTEESIKALQNKQSEAKEQLKNFDAVIQHELAHKRVNQEVKSLQGSFLDEAYACLVGEAAGSTVTPGTTRAQNLDMFKSLLTAWGFSHTPEGAFNALKKAEQLVKNGIATKKLSQTQWGNASSSEMSSFYNYILSEAAKENNEEEENSNEDLLPSDDSGSQKPSIPPSTYQPPGGNTSDGSTGNSSGSGFPAVNPGKVYINGKLGSQTGKWNSFK